MTTRLNRTFGVALLLWLAGAGAASAQGAPVGGAAADSTMLKQEVSADSASQSASGGVGHHQRKVTRQLGELEPVVEWQWGAVAATALAMIGAILLTLPVAVAYMLTKPPEDYDPSVMHSSIILAPTIAGILIVIQGSLAMAFSLAGVATAVRFRNSLKNTNDAVYVFVAVAIGLAAGGQALDIALAISVIFSLMVLLLSRSPFRITGNPRHPAHPHHRHHQPDLAQADSGYLTIRGRDLGQVRHAIEARLERGTKHWRVMNESLDEDGQTIRYVVRFRKRYPPDLLLGELRSLARSQAFTVEATAIPGPAAPDRLTPIPSEARA